MTMPTPPLDPIPAAMPSSPVPPASPAVSGTPVSPAPVAVAAPRRGTPTWVNVALVAALAVAVGGVAFAIGRMTASSPTLSGPGGLVFGGQGPDGGPMTPGGPGRIGVGGGLSIDGTVTAIDGDTLTVTTDTGETQAIELDDTTTYRTATEGTSGDITVGDKVEVGVELDGTVSSGDTPTMTADDVTVVP